MRVVSGPTVGLFVTNGRKARTTVDEFGSQYVPFAQLCAVAPQLFVDQRKLVARADVPYKIDVVLEHLRDIHDQLFRDLCFLSSLKEGRADAASRRHHPVLDRHFNDVGLKPGVTAPDLEPVANVEFAVEIEDGAAIVPHLQDVTRAEHAQILAGLVQLQNFRQVHEAQIRIPEQAVERVAGLHLNSEFLDRIRWSRSDVDRDRLRADCGPGLDCGVREARVDRAIDLAGDLIPRQQGDRNSCDGQHRASQGRELQESGARRQSDVGQPLLGCRPIHSRLALSAHTYKQPGPECRPAFRASCKSLICLSAINSSPCL